MNRALAVTAMMMALDACTIVGPNYHRPDQASINKPAANGAFVSGDEVTYSTEPVIGDWWRLYHDPTLDALVQQALSANTDLRVAAANIARAQAGWDLANADRYPTARVEAGADYGRLSAEEQLIPGGHALPDSGTYNLGISVSYQLDLFGQIARAVESADANRDAAHAAYQATRITVVAETTRAYVDACSAGREFEVARRLLAVQQDSTALTERLLQGGRANRIDVTRSLAQEDQVRATLPTLQAQKRVALFRLAALLGLTPKEIPEAAAMCVQEPHLSQPIPIGDGVALLRRRPDVREAEYELHVATAQIGVATADLYPKITLGASIGSAGLTDNFLKGDTFKYSLGPLISWEFPNRMRANARIKSAQADTDAAYARFDGTVLGALRETESALTVYARDLDHRAMLESARNNAAQAASDTEQMYRLGREAFLPVLDADRTRISAEQAVAAADSKLASDQVSLFLALGGGWEDTHVSMGSPEGTRTARP
jgi:NodT family efflux transporter outer membrane factor (OMF) lipoprotein